MRILSFIYYLITSLRNFLYDKGIFRVKRVPGVEVICIGNITVGGTVKPLLFNIFQKDYKKWGERLQ